MDAVEDLARFGNAPRLAGFERGKRVAAWSVDARQPKDMGRQGVAFAEFEPGPSAASRLWLRGPMGRGSLVSSTQSPSQSP